MEERGKILYVGFSGITNGYGSISEAIAATTELEDANKMNQFTLDGALLPVHKDFGLWLTVAPGDTGIINLIYQGSAVASFPASIVTIREIREIADIIIEVKGG